MMVTNFNVIISIACTEADYDIVYTPCRDPGVRDMQFTWSQPKICDERADGAVTLPETQTGVGCGM